MLLLIIHTSAGTLTLDATDTDKVDVMLSIIDALSVVVYSMHPRYMTLNY